MTGAWLIQIYTASLDGYVHLWHYESGRIEATWQVKHAIESMVLPSRHTAVLSIHWSSRNTGRLMLLNLSQGQDGQTQQTADAPPQSNETKICKLQHASKLVVSPNKEFVATVDGQRVVVLCLKHGRTVMTMLHTRAVTVRSPCYIVSRL